MPGSFEQPPNRRTAFEVSQQVRLVKIHRKAAMAECEGQEKRCAEAQPEVAPNEREQLDVTPLERCKQMMQRMAKAADGPTCPMGSTT